MEARTDPSKSRIPIRKPFHPMSRTSPAPSKCRLSGNASLSTKTKMEAKTDPSKSRVPIRKPFHHMLRTSPAPSECRLSGNASLSTTTKMEAKAGPSEERRIRRLRKLFYRTSKNSPASSRSPLRSNSSPSMANITAHPLPQLAIDSPQNRTVNYGVIDTHRNVNSNNDNTTDNRVDNRVDKSVHNNIDNINHNHGTGTQINHFYSPGTRPQPSDPRKVLFMVPFSKNKGFIGESQTREWLDEKIKRGDFGHHRVALWGMGGIG